MPPRWQPSDYSLFFFFNLIYFTESVQARGAAERGRRELSREPETMVSLVFSAFYGIYLEGKIRFGHSQRTIVRKLP